jgi:beta-catenin-like protein 1
MSGPQGVEVCNAFVEALGLKTLFSAFMGKVSKKGKGTTLPDSEDVNHILGILSSLFSNLDSDSTHRIRLLAKFVENDYEKVDKLLDVRESARTRLQLTDKEIAEEREVCSVLLLTWNFSSSEIRGWTKTTISLRMKTFFTSDD